LSASLESDSLLVTLMVILTVTLMMMMMIMTTKTMLRVWLASISSSLFDKTKTAQENFPLCTWDFWRGVYMPTLSREVASAY
jgi:hypothetical protein